MVLADTGYWLALANSRDRWHAAAVAATRRLDETLVVTWPVITETCHLLISRLGVRAELRFIEQMSRNVEIHEIGQGHLDAVHALVWPASGAMPSGPVREAFVYWRRSKAACIPACHSTKDSTIFAGYMSWGQFFRKDLIIMRGDAMSRFVREREHRAGEGEPLPTARISAINLAAVNRVLATTTLYGTILTNNRSLPYNLVHVVDGSEFIRRARRYAKRAGLAFRYEPRHGKGSHGTLCVGDHRTIVKRGELKPGLFHAMLKQLDIRKEDF